MHFLVEVIPRRAQSLVNTRLASLANGGRDDEVRPSVRCGRSVADEEEAPVHITGDFSLLFLISLFRLRLLSCKRGSFFVTISKLSSMKRLTPCIIPDERGGKRKDGPSEGRR